MQKTIPPWNLPAAGSYIFTVFGLSVLNLLCKTYGLAPEPLTALEPAIARTFGDAGFLAEFLYGFALLIPSCKVPLFPI